MTTASELFYQRRTRIGRNSDSYGVGSDLSSPPPPPSINRRHRHNSSAGGNQSRRDPDGCNPLRRSLHHPRQTSLNRSSQECETVRREEGSHQFSPRNVIHPEPQVNAQDWLMLSGNDRLPGAVLLARERLLQRLRGVMLSDSRQSHRNSAGSQRRGFAMGDDFRLVDAGDWETEISREWLAAASPLTNSVGQRLNMRPPGLTQEALSCLPVEVFCVAQESDEQHVPRASRECSICLESFLAGDQLICLPCGHRYHFSCLDPWVRTCADCPYCRRSIDVTTSDRVKKDPEF
ncbi:probable E3 ubiquitin-protein ligase RHY1A isoform X1 [Salvia hispanica]|uniref:probable E3 ubiquitin-protein ligase RHY1A isoform X1 n=1 Tax=Salvia hispanica TaxID=49212 RepID=UPI0020090FEF|nr:probable E3 ubiquitin-protein ligase RHY1A isoform X1 [Salvia hispanica]